ncbi:MAG: endonuclease/exonuclease/phosphatase family protein [Eubacteriales bacterium]|nr:endonuclease/exonuclease/phosphatase family protein [Eubacteriales bacterium]
MKLITLNTHSLAEPDYINKRALLIAALLEEKADIIAMQEVSQTVAAPPLGGAAPDGYIPADDKIILREDNHAVIVAGELEKAGLSYYYTWIPLKIGYDIYEEGIAIFSKSPITETDVVLLSRVDDFHNWKTRKVIGIRTESSNDWFYSIHLGWWDDEEEPFRDQWLKLMQHCDKKLAHDGACKVWLMGDFNSPAETRGEGYDMMKQSRFVNCHELALQHDDGCTVIKTIDGWEGRSSAKNGLRMDHILCSKPVVVAASNVLFNGICHPVVSDHFGIRIIVNEKQ